MTDGVVLILQFLDAMIQCGYVGQDNALLKARQTGEKYLCDVLLPQWNRDPTFGPSLLGLAESDCYVRAELLYG